MKSLLALTLAVLLFMSAVPRSTDHSEQDSLHMIGFGDDLANFLRLKQGVEARSSFGYNLDIDIAAEEAITSRGGSLVIPPTAQPISIVSTSAADAAAGTGARTVSITCLESDYTEVTFFMTLNGTTAVTSTQECIAINTMAVITAGSGGKNAGQITIQQQTSAIVMRAIPIGDSLTQSCTVTVPKGKRLALNTVRFSVIKLAGAGQPEVTFRSKVYIPTTGVTYTSMRAFIDANNSNIILLDKPFGGTLGTGAVLWFVASTDSNNTQVSCRAYYTYIDTE